MENLTVHCYSGHTYAEEPRSFHWENVEYEVMEIEKAWLEPAERHFQVRTADDKHFHLCYYEATGEWALVELAGKVK